ncbi:3'-5' exonuclease [Streptomyces sp. MJM1172]|uniref:3'-5' exonuclease n=1 Tax=Streptomyces sp. MJM1172 TaxID=1703926 RepID=UPI00093EEC9D|nr:3'-5' exonuclease [Streptomyces sp. MJM1172]OKI50332.1 hypothetical protein AMK15_32775 [Streptomyces sp. MJM1172]
MTVIDPTKLDDLFTREIDEQEVRFVRPGDTDRPDWCAYEGDRFLGMLYAESATGETLWRLGSTTEKHQHLDDAVRALRRPSSWPSERAQVSNWARRLLGDRSLVAVDIETTGLGEAWAVQIAATDRSGRVIFNELVNPLAAIDPEAVAIHKITPDQAATAATFGTLLPALTEALQGRTCVAYKVDFDRGCLERELRRHYGSQAPAEQWLQGCRWVDALEPYAVWRGLWSVKHGRYRAQKLGGPHEAVEDCRFLMARIEQMASAP